MVLSGLNMSEGASTFVGEWVNVSVSGRLLVWVCSGRWHVWVCSGRQHVWVCNGRRRRESSFICIDHFWHRWLGWLHGCWNENQWLGFGRRTRRRWWYLLDFCLAIVLYRLFELPFTTLQTFFLQTKMMKTQTPCKEIIWWMIHLIFKSGLPGTCSRCLWEPANEKRGQSWGSQSTRWFPCQGRDAGISASCPSSRWCRHWCQSQNYEYVETVLKLKRIVIAVPCHSFWKGH